MSSKIHLSLDYLLVDYLRKTKLLQAAAYLKGRLAADAWQPGRSREVLGLLGYLSLYDLI